MDGRYYTSVTPKIQMGGLLTASDDEGHKFCQTANGGITLVRVQWHMSLEKRETRVLGEYADSKYLKLSCTSSQREQ
jgi:hypothetical protein